MADAKNSGIANRGSEYFVPQFGPAKFRTFIGLMYLPYNGMVLSFSVIVSLPAVHIFYDRVLAIVIIYFIGLGLRATPSKANTKTHPFSKPLLSATRAQVIPL